MANGEIDIAASTIFPEEDSSDDQSSVHTPIGLDGLAVIVNRRNPTEELTILQLRDLFGGRLLTWSAFDSSAPADNQANIGDNEIVLVSREEAEQESETTAETVAEYRREVENNQAIWWYLMAALLMLAIGEMFLREERHN